MSEGERYEKEGVFSDAWDDLGRLRGYDEDRPLVLHMDQYKVVIYFLMKKYPGLRKSDIIPMFEERGFTLDITSVPVTFDVTECETAEPHKKENKICLKRPAKGVKVQMVCKWWRLDRCTKGNRCRFLHCELTSTKL